MRRILHIPNYYFPHTGGIEKTCQYLAEGTRNYDVRVVCFSEDKKNKIENINGIKVYKAGVQFNIMRQSLSISYHKILKKVITEFQPDIIHFHYPNPFVTSILLPLIDDKTKLYIHWHLDITKQKSIYPLIKNIETRLLRRADLIVTTSPNYRDSSIPLKQYIDKVQILPSAIDFKNYELTENEKQKVQEIKDNANGRKIILYAGRHVLHKGIEELIKSEPLIDKDSSIFIAGNGPITKKIMDGCESKRVKWLGHLSNSDLKCYYYAADIYAFPSYTRAEAFGLALAEAMYCYCAPITFNIKGSGVNWVSLNGITGIEVENRNIEEYAKAINTLLNDDDLRKKYSLAAHERIKNEFSVENEIQILNNQYKQLLNSK